MNKLSEALLAGLVIGTVLIVVKLGFKSIKI
jgi:hypothetical protein